MAVEHSALTGASLHEPKGVASATSGDVYVADGAGSGNWTNKSAYGSLVSIDTDSVSISTIGTTAKKLEAFSSNGDSSGTTPDYTSDDITIDTDGYYIISFSITLATVAAGDAGLYTFHLRKNAGEQGAACQVELSGSSDTTTVGFTTSAALVDTDVLTIYVESDNGGDTDDISVPFTELMVYKVG